MNFIIAISFCWTVTHEVCKVVPSLTMNLSYQSMVWVEDHCLADVEIKAHPSTCFIEWMDDSSELGHPVYASTSLICTLQLDQLRLWWPWFWSIDTVLHASMICDRDQQQTPGLIATPASWAWSWPGPPPARQFVWTKSSVRVLVL